MSGGRGSLGIAAHDEIQWRLVRLVAGKVSCPLRTSTRSGVPTCPPRRARSRVGSAPDDRFRPRPRNRPTPPGTCGKPTSSFATTSAPWSNWSFRTWAIRPAPNGDHRRGSDHPPAGSGLSATWPSARASCRDRRAARHLAGVPVSTRDGWIEHRASSLDLAPQGPPLRSRHFRRQTGQLGDVV